MGEVPLQLFFLNNETEDCFDMPHVYDLIHEHDSQPITATMQAEDVFEAWRLDRER